MSSFTSINDFINIGIDTIRAQAFRLPFNVAGLKSTTQFKFFWNGVDMTFACKPFGGRLTSNLVSNSSGRLFFTFYFQEDHQDSKVFDNSPVTVTKTSPQVVIKQNFWELKGAGGSYGSGYVPMRQLVKPLLQSR